MPEIDAKAVGGCKLLGRNVNFLLNFTPIFKELTVFQNLSFGKEPLAAAFRSPQGRPNQLFLVEFWCQAGQSSGGGEFFLVSCAE